MSSNRSRQMFLVTSSGGIFCLVENFRMHPHHQHFLVIRAIEDADAAALRQAPGGAPHEIVIEFVAGRGLNE